MFKICMHFPTNWFGSISLNICAQPNCYQKNSNTNMKEDEKTLNISASFSTWFHNKTHWTHDRYWITLSALSHSFWTCCRVDSVQRTLCRWSLDQFFFGLFSNFHPSIYNIMNTCINICPRPKTSIHSIQDLEV